MDYIEVYPAEPLVLSVIILLGIIAGYFVRRAWREIFSPNRASNRKRGMPLFR